MNHYNFLQTGGFPMDVNVLDRMQTAYQLFNGLGALAGDFSIIKGCELTGSTVSNGVVYINGEVLEFRSAVVATSVVIVEESSSSIYENGQVKPTHFVRYATFGVATTSYPWILFKRAFPTRNIPEALEAKLDISEMEAILERIETLEKKNAVFQTGGGMVLWNKPAAQIPEGWAEVEDWRGRMPVGWNPVPPEEYQSEVFDTVGKMGGNTHNHITINQMPSHNHAYGDIYWSESGGSIPLPGNRGSGDTDGDNSGYEVARGTAYTGSGQAFNIMNPYRVVLFIEYIG